MAYYDNINPDILSLMPESARNILELGCGAGALARAYRQRNPDCVYRGVELSPTHAASGRTWMNEVICGDIESETTLLEIDKDLYQAPDLLICGDVLEHLENPWETLKTLTQKMTADAICIVCMPNVAHWSLVYQQLSGTWNYTDQGLLDRTHLRFFTRKTAEEMLDASGWHIEIAKPRIFNRELTEQAVQEFVKLSPALGISESVMTENLSAFQWVFLAKRKT